MLTKPKIVVHDYPIRKPHFRVKSTRLGEGIDSNYSNQTTNYKKQASHTCTGTG